MTDQELLAKATVFELLSWNPRATDVPIGRIRELKVERRTAANDPEESWAIVNSRECLNHKGEWEYEPQPSSRNKAFLKRCRWSDLRSAIAFAEDHLLKYPLGFAVKDKDELARMMMTRAQLTGKIKHGE